MKKDGEAGGYLCLKIIKCGIGLDFLKLKNSFFRRNIY